MRQDEQAVTKEDKSLVTLADYAAQRPDRRANPVARRARGIRTVEDLFLCRSSSLTFPPA